ncbi:MULTISPECIES: 6-hydroxymethylpterin diphosphokinase MptE-like protein [Halomicrobium]|uniref:6-hydroxymethyl-7,8-dihydropterin pyrophosphokinase n=2 Tax=Halomicrobium mukohataei TaxID=57705 RepID=C7P083_HALMD|nr:MULTISPECIES: 6-hydroxymethylpterin diphosphokinase MptE-like protein [Halomicrobium]ACV48875.1 protein of unknown function DUF115 [Halomicrobium mukohataei DSM 12286]QCD64304.1 DUF115 domain-containing protein [Halomicrobium mukohataei]QFR19110.1 DUF115 domain-containing protein [Halomicrobium sp. ZPS1]
MDYHHWNPVYEAILSDFGYPRAGDERARDRLAALLAGASTLDPESIDLAGRTVAVAGGGPSLYDDIDLAVEADAVVAASTAADRLLATGVEVDCVVTDLDKHSETVVRLTNGGTPVAIHAHGDNLGLVESTVPECDAAAVLPTTQAAPADGVANFGGFTDGDRAAFLADHLGGATLVFPGWSFDDPSVSAQKRRKLDWAERLLYWLERRRGERFDVLDGRRGGIDTSALPVE